MAILTRRKTAALALVVVGVAGLSIASAAQLNLAGTASLGAGETVVAACQPTGDPISVSFDNVYGDKVYNTKGVKLTAINEACGGLNYKVTVVAGSSTIEVPGTVTAGTTNVVLPNAVAAKNVTDVAVVIFD